MSDARRIQLQPAYVLHHRPYRDTSLILELFTRDHGRVSVFARGARGSGRSGSSSLVSITPVVGGIPVRLSMRSAIDAARRMR